MSDNHDHEENHEHEHGRDHEPGHDHGHDQENQDYGHDHKPEIGSQTGQPPPVDPGDELGEEPDQTVDPLILPLPSTNRPVAHDAARAKIYIDGLSLLGFNSKENRAEVGFFRMMHEPVEIKIRDKDCQEVRPAEGTFPADSTLGMTVNINTDKSGIGQCYENGPDDPESFSRLPNLESWHGTGSFSVSHDDDDMFISARINICDAVFYTQKISRHNAFRFTKEGAKPIKRKPLKQIGRIAGADIFRPADENLKVEVLLPNRQKYTFNLLPAGAPYEIVLRTRPEHHMPEMSHLPIVYGVLDKPDSDHRVFELVFEEKESPFESPCEEKQKKTQEEIEELAKKVTQFECQIFIDSGGGW